MKPIVGRLETPCCGRREINVEGVLLGTKRADGTLEFEYHQLTPEDHIRLVSLIADDLLEQVAEAFADICVADIPEVQDYLETLRNLKEKTQAVVKMVNKTLRQRGEP